jgi:Putative phage metallopeptidase
MATKLTQASAETLAVLAEVVKIHFADLAGVHIAVLMSDKRDADDKPIEALKDRGISVAGKIKQTPADWRAENPQDVVITLCLLSWQSMNGGQKAGLIHHLLMQLTPDGRDGLGRVKFVRNPVSYRLEGYRQTIDAYGENSPEAVGVRTLEPEFRQQVFGFADFG